MPDVAVGDGERLGLARGSVADPLGTTFRAFTDNQIGPVGSGGKIGATAMPDENSPQTRRDVALRNLIKAAHCFLDRVKDRSDLLDIEEYWELDGPRPQRQQLIQKILDQPRSAQT